MHLSSDQRGHDHVPVPEYLEARSEHPEVELALCEMSQSLLNSVRPRDEVVESPDFQHIAGLATLMSSLSYNEYRAIEGLVQRIRRRESVDLHSEAHRYEKDSVPYQVLIGLAEESHLSKQDLHDFGTDTILLLRASARLGKNVVNVGFDEKLGSFSFDATLPAEIMCGGGTRIFINPGEGYSEVTVEGRTHKLSDNAWLIVGKPLSFSEVFRRNLGRSIEVPVEAKVMHDSKVSRGAIMLLRRGNELWIFDRGAYYPVICTQAEKSVTYDPTIQSEDGIGFGGSIVERRDGF